MPTDLADDDDDANESSGTRSGRPLQKNAAVSGAYVAAVPPVATETAAYFTLTNTGKGPLSLTGVSSTAARSGMLMTLSAAPQAA